MKIKTKIKILNFFYRLNVGLARLFSIKIPPIISVAALIKREGKMLFLDLSYANGLGTPGGVIEINETVEEALKREVAEETGLKVVNYKYLWSVFDTENGINMLNLVFEVETEGETKDSEEGVLKWLPPQEAKGKMAYQIAEKVLKKYLNP